MTKIKISKDLEKDLLEMNFRKHEHEDTTDYVVTIPSQEEKRRYLLVLTLDHQRKAVVFSIAGKDFTDETQVIRLAAFKESFLEKRENIKDYIKKVYELLRI